MISRILDWFAPLQPAEPSTLDLWDSPRRWDGCMVLDCAGEVALDIFGWRTCTDHAPVSV